MPGPFVSICIPTFQAGRYLPATLASVRAQTFSDWELVVAEDGSHDQAEEIVREFAASVAQPVRFHRQAENCGAPATRNTCIAIARSEWIALLDADDEWMPNHLQASIACARWHDTAIVHGGAFLFDQNKDVHLGIRAPAPRILSELPQALFRGDYAIPLSSVLLRRSLWERVGGFDPAYRYHESPEMWLRCARAGAQFAYTGRETCFHRRHLAAPPPRAAAMAVAHAEMLEKNADWEALPVALRRRCAAAGWQSAGRVMLSRDAHAARQLFLRALHHRAFAPVTLAYWLLASARIISRRTSLGPPPAPSPR